MVQDMRAGIEDVFEATNAAQQQEYLPEGSEELAEGDTPPEMTEERIVSTQETSLEKVPSCTLRRQSTASGRAPDLPTLALTPAQFAMIKALDDVGFRKFPVHIHNSSHSHAAMIVRTNRKAFEEGKVVVKHWLDQAFSI